MAVFNNILAGAAGQTGGAAGYEITRSLRFDSSSSSYLNRTPSSAGNRKTWTWSGWVKRSKLGADQQIWWAQTPGSPTLTDYIRFDSDDTFRFFTYNNSAGSFVWQLHTSAKFRDPSSWYHIVCSIDTTQSTASDRAKLYINGYEVTDFSTSAYPSQNYDTNTNNTVSHNVAAYNTNSSFFDGYLADVHFIDGVSGLTASDFGEYDDNNVWQPIEYSGTYGTNGFHLDFSDNSSNAALGNDSSGNNNDWTVNNLVASVSASGSVNYASSSNWTQIGNGLASGSSYNNAWDGNTTGTFLNFLTNTGGNNDVAYTFPGSGVPVSSYVRLYVGVHSNNERQWRVNNQSYQANNTTGYLQYNFSGTLTSIDGYNTWNGGNSIQLYAVEVDGTVLTYVPPETLDSLIDTPTNYEAASGNNGGNYATWNPLDKDNTVSYANGNLEAAVNAGSTNSTYGTVSISSGKWYWEVVIGGGNGSSSMIGVAESNKGTARRWTGANGWYYYETGVLYNNLASTSYGASYTNGDVIGVALDMDNGNLVFYKNGSSQGTAYSTGTFSGKKIMPAIGNGGGANVTYTVNFGQRPFAYTPPTGYVSLCTQNLTDPTIADGSTAMDVALWSGDNTNPRSITTGFEPDLVWIKARNQAYYNTLYDSVRTATARALSSNTTDKENGPTNNWDTSNGYLSSFDATGFTLTGGSTANYWTNRSGVTYVAWTWDGGTSTVSNTDGSITSSVRANASAGFSIVTATASSAGDTIGHGLNAPLGLIIAKRTNTTSHWPVYHSSVGANGFVYLNLTNAAGTGSDFWNNVTPTSSVFTVGSDSAVSGGSAVFYCFAPVEGYSAFGSYTGNGSTDGPFVYTGFRPKFILVKRTDTTAPWVLRDSTRDFYNGYSVELYPNNSNAEGGPYTPEVIDYLSNGFKLRSNTATASNGSGGTFIYAAFAEHPFKTARAR